MSGNYSHLENLFSAFSGASLALIQHAQIPVLFIHTDPLLSIVVDAGIKGIVGGTIGYFVSYGFDKLLKRKK